MSVVEIVTVRLESFARRHSILMLLATLLLASLATMVLLSQAGTAGTLVLYEGF
jgi:hypothetical protein